MTEHISYTLVFLFFILIPPTGHTGAVVACWTLGLKVPGLTPSLGLGTQNQVPGLQSLRKTIVVIKRNEKLCTFF